jgi:hypothetical protein
VIQYKVRSTELRNMDTGYGVQEWDGGVDKAKILLVSVLPYMEGGVL